MIYEKGPVAVAVDAQTWYNYQGGIIQHHCENHNNHAVQIVGYDISGTVNVLNFPTLLFLSSNKMLITRSEIHKMLVRLSKREDTVWSGTALFV